MHVKLLRFIQLRTGFALAFICFWNLYGLACAGITVNFTSTQTGSCIPKKVDISNTSTGSLSGSAIYQLFVDGTLVDTTHGKSKTFSVNLYRGSHTVMLKSIDNNSCVDSAVKTVTVSKAAWEFTDYQGSYSDNPQWINCIQQSTDPDSFFVKTRSKDSLRSVHIIWGDGATTSINNLKKDSVVQHLFVLTGTFTTYIITTDTGGCKDTTIGTVINERIPTAGIIGPNSGFNVGCAPFTINFVNNSSNISNGTSFTWDLGDGSTVTKDNSTFNQVLAHEYTSTLCNGTVRLIASNACGFSQTTWNPIQVSKPDRAIFTMDSSNCDSSGSYTFTNLSADSFCIFPDSKQYLWDFGDGTNSGWITSKGPISHKYKEQGPKKVCLITKNKCGQDTSCQPITIVYTPIVAFDVDTLLGCGAAMVRVKDSSIGYGLTRLWQWGDGTSSTNKNDSHQYVGRGTYNLRFRVSNRCGSRSLTRQVVIKDKPTATFSGITNGCADHTISLTNTSSTDFTNSAQYVWNFGNGDTSLNSNPPAVTYTDSGTYNISLVVSDTCGADTQTQIVRVDKIPTIQVTADSALCSLDTVAFNNTSFNYDFLIVDYGDGSNNDSIFNTGRFEHVYTDSGTYQVIIRAVNEVICEARDTLYVIIKPNSQAVISLSDTAACAPFTFRFQNDSRFASSYKWFINDTFITDAKQLDSISITTDSVLKEIKLVAIDTIGCKTDTATQLVFTGKNPIADFVTKIDSGCSPLLDTLVNTSQYSEFYAWQFGNGTQSSIQNPAINFTSAPSGDTTYDIRLIATTWLGCVDTTYGNRKVFPVPIADFTMDTNSGCYPVTVNFTNQSDPNGLGTQNDMSFAWGFGNGNTDTVTHPKNIAYVDAKTQDSIYIVQLAVTSTNGCPATITDTVTVYPKPTIHFSFSDSAGCGPLAISLTNNSRPNNNGNINMMSFMWDLGNGQTSTQQQPSSSYAPSLTRDSFYTVKLVGYTEHQCVDSFKKTIQVYPKPLAQFELDTNSGCSPLQVQFTNTSIPFDTSDINDMRFLWDFGNGNTSNQINDTATYTESAFQNKQYFVRLVAFSEHSCSDTTFDTTTVYPTPNAVFSKSDTAGCGPLLVDFTNGSQLNDTNYWNINNHGFSISPNDTQYVFPFALLQDTTYSIKLATKSKNGCVSDTAEQMVTVWSQPIAEFTIANDTICHYDTFNFTNTSTGATQYHWDFGDGDSSTGIHANHQYTKGTDAFKALDFSVRLIASTNHNCRDTAYNGVQVHPFTIADIGNQLDSFCSSTTINFTNASTNYNSSFWDFGNGNTTTSAQPSFFYQNISNVTKNLMVTLRTENAFGCIDNDTIRFRIMPEPIADFSPFRLNVCDSGYHTLVNRSINNETNEWDFGDGNISTEKEPYHLFARNDQASTNYTVRLIVKNYAGCPDTASATINLNPIHTVDFDTSLIRSVCVGDPIDFLNRSTFATYHKWVFGDGGESRDSLPNYFYGNSGLYDVKYIGYDVNGCPDSITKQAMAQVFDRPTAAFGYSPTAPKMPNALVSFNNLSQPLKNLTYSWDFDDAATSNLQHPNHAFSDSGHYVVQLIVDNGFCADTTSQPIYVAPPLPIPDFIANDTAGCGPFEVQFTAQSQHADRYRWFFDDGTESEETNPTHTFVFEGYYDIGLVAYGPGGQADTTYKKMIRVYPRPTAYFSIAEKERYLPNALFSPTNESVDASTYQWYVHDETKSQIAASSDEYPTFTLNQVGKFSMELHAINTFGCIDTFIRPLYLTVIDSGYVFVPTAFSPTKSPGLNDAFKPTMEGVSPDGYLFSVYNRWGEKIFETTDVNGAWDGTYQSTVSEMEQYIFVVSGRFYSGQVFEEKGTVLLMR